MWRKRTTEHGGWEEISSELLDDSEQKKSQDAPDHVSALPMLL